ncbi:MAG: ATP synthase subunit I [Pseudomonadota bacterium]
MLKVLALQTTAGLVVAAAFWMLSGTIAGYSALLGSLACVLPNAFLASRLALSRRDGTAGALMRAAWLGEAGKLALTALFLTAIFIGVRPLAAAPLLIGFIVSQSMVLAGLLLKDENEPKDLED